jgi:hypothetical protein
MGTEEFNFCVLTQHLPKTFRKGFRLRLSNTSRIPAVSLRLPNIFRSECQSELAEDSSKTGCQSELIKVYPYTKQQEE